MLNQQELKKIKKNARLLQRRMAGGCPMTKGDVQDLERLLELVSKDYRKHRVAESSLKLVKLKG